MIRVVIADDHEVVRQGLRFLLSCEPGIEVAGEAADGAAALDAVRALRPDVLLLDLFMPKLDGISVLRCLRDEGLAHMSSYSPRPRTTRTWWGRSRPGRSRSCRRPPASTRSSRLSAPPPGAKPCSSPPRPLGFSRNCAAAPLPIRRARSPPGNRRAAGGSPRPREPGDRQDAIAVRRDGEEPRVQHPGQTRPRRPHPGSDLRPPAPRSAARRSPRPLTGLSGCGRSQGRPPRAARTRPDARPDTCLPISSAP